MTLHVYASRGICASVCIVDDSERSGLLVPAQRRVKFGMVELGLVQ